MEEIVNYLVQTPGYTPYIAVFAILLLCGLGLPIPEDITLFAAGMISYYGASDVWVMIFISYAGVMLGDSFIFMLGSKYGKKIAKKGFLKRLLPPERLTYVQKRLNKRGNWVIFAARFMPGLRAPVYFTCGTLHVPYRVFFFFDGLAAILSVPLIVYLVYYFGDNVDVVIRDIKRFQYGIISVIVGIILFLVLKWRLNKKKFQKLNKSS